METLEAKAEWTWTWSSCAPLHINTQKEVAAWMMQFSKVIRWMKLSGIIVCYQLDLFVDDRIIIFSQHKKGKQVSHVGV